MISASSPTEDLGWSRNRVGKVELGLLQRHTQLAWKLLKDAAKRHVVHTPRSREIPTRGAVHGVRNGNASRRRKGQNALRETRF